MRIGPIVLFEKSIVGPAENPLLIRWKIFRCRWFGIWIHKLLRSDHDKALHDHPWGFISIILKGGYQEIHHVRDINNVGQYGIIEESEVLSHSIGSILFRPAEWRHRVIIEGKPSWNLIFVGERRRFWGFWSNGEWCFWRKYNTDLGICEEDIIHKDNND